MKTFTFNGGTFDDLQDWLDELRSNSDHYSPSEYARVTEFTITNPDYGDMFSAQEQEEAVEFWVKRVNKGMGWSEQQELMKQVTLVYSAEDFEQAVIDRNELIEKLEERQAAFWNTPEYRDRKKNEAMLRAEFYRSRLPNPEDVVVVNGNMFYREGKGDN